MALSDNLRSLIFRNPAVRSNNSASAVTWQDAWSYILPDLIAIADAATGGAGDVFGPASSLDQEIVIYSGTTGKTITNSGITLADLIVEIFPGALQVNAATTGVLAGSPTYDNGIAGVGATLTKGSNGAFPTIDGVAAALNNTYLVKNQADQTQNGKYTLSTLGTGSTPWVLTRTTDSDESSELNGQVIVVGAGTTNKRRIYSQTTVTPTIGTNNIVYSQTPAPNMTGYVKRDGTVDFIGTETWDFGGTDTTTIADTGINISDASDSMNVNKTSLIFNDISNTGSMSKSGVGVTDGAGAAANVAATDLNVYNGTDGSTYIYPNRIKTTHGATNAVSEVLFIKHTIVADDIKGLNSLPKEIVAQPGGGKAINVLSCVAVNTFGAVAFTSNNIHLDCGGNATQYLLTTSDNFLNTAATLIERMFPNSNSAVSAVLIEDTPLTVMADADSPVGDGTVALYITYQIITL